MQIQEPREVLLDIIEKHSQEGKKNALPKLSSETIEGIYHFAYQFYLNGKYAESIKFFRFLTLVDTGTKKHWMGLGAALQMQKEYTQAIHTYSVAAILDELDPYVHLYAAECFFALEKVNDGIVALDSALKAAKLKKMFAKLIPELNLLKEAWIKRVVEA